MRSKLNAFVALVLFNAIVMSSCETLVNDIPESRLPRTESELTVFAFISPQDTIIRVKVSQTYPLFGAYTPGAGSSLVIAEGDTLAGDFDGITTATVTISNGTSSATLGYDPVEQVYTIPASQFAITTETTYYLTVSDGSRIAQASCTVPPRQVPIKDYNLDTIIAGPSQSDTSLTMHFRWDDVAGISNYYRVKAFELFGYTQLITDSISQTAREMHVLGRSYFAWEKTFGRNVFQEDVGLDGTTFSSPQGAKRKINLQYLTALTDSNIVKIGKPPQSRGLYLMLLNTDSHYYQFHHSINAQDDNPFSEPAGVYTNVTGGLGIFAAYNQTLQIIKK